ncbi:TPA: hypothetical protein ACVU4C_003000 [Vibrio parahaemolyticus]|uniref:ParE family toxin-like protein n=1 Tax=Vibrio TaxID=662 RepID=UPI003CC633FE
MTKAQNIFASFLNGDIKPRRSNGKKHQSLEVNRKYRVLIRCESACLISHSTYNRLIDSK